MKQDRRISRSSTAVDVMLSPRLEYSQRMAESAAGSWAQALAGPALLALLLGIVTSIAATGRVVVSLVVSQTLCWSFVPLLQVATGSALIASAPGRRVTFRRALELFFAGHGPWSFWLVAIAGLQMITARQNVVLASAAAPAVWTAWIVHGFAREVLDLTSAQARLRTIGHLAATVLLIATYMELANRLSVRLIGFLQR
jgi:hypothetical protein